MQLRVVISAFLLWNMTMLRHNQAINTKAEYSVLWGTILACHAKWCVGKHQ